MLKIAKETKLAPETVISRAASFFGEPGEGLAERERNPCCVTFEGGGGHVSVAVYEEEGKRGRTVEVETREFEHQAKRFLEKL